MTTLDDTHLAETQLPDARLGPGVAMRGRPALLAAVRRLMRAEVLAFLLVGGVGYLVDVGVFNILWGTRPFDAWDPSIAKVTAVALAMVVTYLGNRFLTWRDRSRPSARRALLFVAFNVVGLGFSVVTLWVSHDLLGLRTRLDDNLSANVVGVALGTAFRYWTYRRVVFVE